MKLRIEIELDNAAFVEGGVGEVERILADIASRLPDPLDQTGGQINIHDANCNHVGYAEIVDDVRDASGEYVAAAEQLAEDIRRGGGKCNAWMAGRLIRLATRHHALMARDCNEGEPLPELAEVRGRIEAIAKKCNLKGVIFSGDPRGATVRLLMPSGETNDWAGEGWIVPTR